jgi:hypothetical protein
MRRPNDNQQNTWRSKCDKGKYVAQRPGKVSQGD